jgi:uncharacterized protein with HEPN domain
MSKPRRDRQYLGDLLEAMRRIQDYTDDLTYESFLADTMTQDAVVRNLQVMGETAKKLSDSVKDGTSDVPWREMAGTRDRLVHEYFGIEWEIVWVVAREQIPPLIARIENILRSLH